jgi:hypothetical protein
MSTPRKEGQIDRMNDLLSRLHAEIEALEIALQPVRTPSPDRELAIPQEIPANRLHEFILAIETANNRLRMLHSELQL